MIELHLPFPPSVNHAYGRDPRDGHTYRKSKVDAYQLGVLVACRCQGVVRPELAGRLAVEVDVHQPPEMERVDIGNLDKCLMDALTVAGVWRDDEQVDDVRYRRCAREEGGAVVVRIHELGAEARAGA